MRANTLENRSDLLHRYLAPGTESLWNWDEKGEVIIWSDGATIVFREELEQILLELVPSGLPPFEAIIYILASLKNRFHDHEIINNFTNKNFLSSPSTNNPHDALSGVMKSHAKEQLEFVFKKLSELPSIPSEFTQTPHQKAVLCEMLLENTNRNSINESTSITNYLKEGLLPSEIQKRELSETNAIIKNLVCLLEGLKNFSVDRFKNRLQTGIEEPPQQIPHIDLPLNARVLELLQELTQDLEFQGLAKVVKDIMAALTLPRPLTEQDETALGGIADISNRGPLHRLLLSELAHDDFTLCVRIALNEALYLKNEPPSHSPPGGFTVLLDSGIRMWGIPRMFSIATALALLAKAPPHLTCSTYRPIKDKAKSFDIGTKKGLLEQLTILEPTPQPGASFPNLISQLDDQLKSQEVIIITHINTLNDESFIKALSHFKNVLLYIAILDQDGNFKLIQNLPKNQITLCEAKINLESLFTINTKQQNQNLKNQFEDLPSFFSISPPPFLLPITGKEEIIAEIPSSNDEDFGGSICVTSRGGWIWKNKNMGALSLFTKNETQGKALSILFNTNPNYSLIPFYCNSRKTLTVIRINYNLNSSLFESESFILTSASFSHPPSSTFLFDNFLFIIFPGHIDIFDPKTGKSLGRIELQTYKSHLRENFFLNKKLNRIESVSFNGVEIIYHDCCDASDIATIFSRKGIPGPWILKQNGEIGPINSDPTLTCSLFKKFVISFDGHRIWLQTNQTSAQITDLNSNKTKKFYISSRNPIKLLHPELERYEKTLWVHLSKIGFTQYGKLVLVSNKETILLWNDLKWNEKGRNLQSDSAYQEVRPFKELENVNFKNFPYELKSARWEDGSQAFLDKRGLLHLCSSDKNIPEISLVLANGSQSAGWTSEDQYYGDTFFTEEKNNHVGNELDALIQQFAFTIL